MNPDLLLSVVGRTCGFCLEDNACFRALFGLQLARRLAKPKIYDLVGFSLRRGSVLALAGKRRSGRWPLACPHCKRLRSTRDFRCRRLADSRRHGPSRLVSRFV